MNFFKVVEIHNGSQPDHEFVLLEALEDVNISGYQVEDRTFRRGKNTDVFRHVFRFPDLDVKKGECVALFTCKGNPHKERYEGKIYHVLYWGSDQCIWNDDENDSVELLRVFTKQVYKRKKKRA